MGNSPFLHLAPLLLSAHGLTQMDRQCKLHYPVSLLLTNEIAQFALLAHGGIIKILKSKMSAIYPSYIWMDLISIY